MNENNFDNIIENLYLEKKNIENSKEYRLGKNIYSIKKYIINFEFKKFFHKIKNFFITKKYNKKYKCYVKNNKIYKSFVEDKKIVVYTCITGNYDNICEPIYKEQKCDYVLYTNNYQLMSNKFDVKVIDNNLMKKYDNVALNRYIKMHPHELFEKEYDYAIYIDGNIKVVSNISAFINCVNSNYGIAMHKHSQRDCIYKEVDALKILKKGNLEKIIKQIKLYRKEEFPNEYGMLEANVIVTDLKNSMSKKIYDEWWREFLNSESKRDQLSLPYILWKMKVDIKDIGTLGDNVFDNKKIDIIKHN